MALNAAQQWWMRAGGLETNGGGFDATISGAGTNYADQDSPQLSITDLTSTNSTTATSALSTFTSQMVGNILRLASGTGTTPAYYAIVAYVSASQVTLDRVSGTYTAGVAKVGGAHPSIGQYSNGGSITAPAIATPLAAGHTVNIRGAGSADPSSPDYTYGGGVYASFPAGDTTNGRITWLGYNGRPRINCDALLFYQVSNHAFSHIKLFIATATYPNYGVINGVSSTVVTLTDSIVDSNGSDCMGVSALVVVACWFKNSGSTSVGTNTYAAIVCLGYNSTVIGNVIDSWRGDGVYTDKMCNLEFNIIVNCKVHGVECANVTDAFMSTFVNNTIHGHTGDGIKLTSAAAILSTIVRNNILTGNGGYGLNDSVGSTSLNDRTAPYGGNDYNNYGTGGTANTSGARHFLSAGANDLALDPQFTNAGAGDYSVGTNMKAVAFPGPFAS